MSKDILRNAYIRNADRPVAFIDESLRGPNEPGYRFYILTAVVVNPAEMDDLRDGIEGIVDGTFWHTSEAMLAADGELQARGLLRYLGQGEETSVVAATKSIHPDDHDLEGARRTCMSTLLPALEAGSSRRESTRLAIAEKRRTQKQQNRDTATHTLLVKTHAISRQFRLLQASPHHEHLLWLPDLVSFAVRREMAQQGSDLLDLVRPQVEWV